MKSFRNKTPEITPETAPVEPNDSAVATSAAPARRPVPKSRVPKIVPKDAPAKFNGWDDTPTYRRNGFQKVAAKTRGIVTPGNVITVGANALAIDGIIDICAGHYIEGTVKFAAGRAGDYADGKAARGTGTQSWLGEGLDVAGDKIQTVVGLGALSIYGDYPLEASVPKLATQLAIVGISGLATKRGADLHPGMPGKIALGTTGVSMVGFEAANGLAAEHAEWAHATNIGSYILTAASILAGGKAAWDYHRAGQEAQAAASTPAELDPAGPVPSMPDPSLNTPHP